MESQETNQAPKSGNTRPTGQQNTQAPGVAKPAEEAAPEPSKGDPNGPEGDAPGQPSGAGPRIQLLQTIGRAGITECAKPPNPYLPLMVIHGTIGKATTTGERGRLLHTGLTGS